MATRAKYTRVRATEEDKEQKPDTDILMRFSPRYGTPSPIQESMSHALSLSSLVRTKSLSPLRLLNASWTKPFGFLR